MNKLLIASLALAAGAPLSAQGFPCWEANLGTNLALGDDQVSPAQPLGFNFPFAGGTVTDVEVSSNGFVYLGTGNTSSGCCNGNISTLLTGAARIAPCWQDLNPAAGGAVYFNALPNRAVITWDQVPEYGSSTNFCTVQLQMDSSGSFQISIQDLTTPTTHDLLVGVSEGVAAVDPGESDYSAGVVASLGNPTVYEFFGRTEGRDIAGRTLWFLPDGSGGYIVSEIPNCRFASFSTYGVGCPGNGPVHYEFFDFFGNAETTDLDGLSVRYQALGGGRYLITPTASSWETNFGTSLGLTDDSLSGPQALGFTADICGVMGVADVDVSSNGFVYVGTPSSASSGCCSGNLQTHLDGDPRIAGLWQDLNPSAGGTVYFNALPGKAVITYDQVPEFSQTNANTFQIQIYADGSFTIEWQTVSNLSHDCLVGMSGGGGKSDPGEDDISAMNVIVTEGASAGPVTLSSTGRPAIGTPITVDVGNLPQNSVAGFMIVGFTQVFPGMSLANLGMPGCLQFISLDDTLSMPVTPGSNMTSFTFNVPNNASLVGFDAFVQAAIFVPGINQLGLVASNGGVLAIGQ